jgi:molecular chaperone DnaK (HSP70)
LFEVERAKRELTTAADATVTAPEALRTAEGARDLVLRIRREIAEQLWRPAIQRSIDVCGQALGRAGVRTRDLSAIYLSGGTSYVPAVRAALEQAFQVPVQLGIPPEYAAAVGAGLLAADIDRRMALPLTSPVAL